MVLHEASIASNISDSLRHAVHVRDMQRSASMHQFGKWKSSTWSSNTGAAGVPETQEEALCVVTFSVGVGFALLQLIEVECSRMQAIVGSDLEQCSDCGLRKIRKAIGIRHVGPFVERDIGPP